MALVTLSAVIHREGDLYVAECPELGTVSQEKSIEEAVANLKEATGPYLEEQEEPPGFAPAILTTGAPRPRGSWHWLPWTGDLD